MFTIIESISRQFKRYNRNRGAALLMVIMTMAVIIVVGSSMIYITLSSFSTSLADTNQSRAANAAATMAENIKDTMADVVKAYENEILESETGSATVKFVSTQNFAGNEEIVDYTEVNGAKVVITMTNVASDFANVVKRAQVDVAATYKGQTSMVSFFIDRTDVTTQYTIEDTYGNAFVMTSDMGSAETKTTSLIFKRIEGDVSINCYEDVEENGETVSRLVTKTFNPTLLEGLTGSIFANGDLIIGSADNTVKIGGNIYCDGNLTIRGLDIGLNLPAIHKKEYKSKFANYYTVKSRSILGIHLIGTKDGIYHVTSGNVKPGTVDGVTIKTGGSYEVGDVMYAINADGEFEPMQVYDQTTHYTLVDRGIKEFWTKVYADDAGTKFDKPVWEKVTVGDSPNKSYYGAVMYYPDEDGEQPDEEDAEMIRQFPEGGNIYCSGDVIFDTANSGNLCTYDSGISGGLSEGERSYYDLAYENASTPAINQTTIRGDVFCQGRMIVVPNPTKNTGLYYTFTNGNYLKATDVDTGGTYDSAFKALVSSLWGTSNKALGTYNLTTYVRYRATYDAVNTSELKLNGDKQSLADYLQGYNEFCENYAESYVNLGLPSSDASKKLDEIFRGLINSNTLYTNVYQKVSNLSSGSGTMPVAGGAIRTVKFSEDSDIYCQNAPLRKTDYALIDTNRVVTNNDAEKSVVGGQTYTEALTIKFTRLDINRVFVNGDINVISSEVLGYDRTAKLTADYVDYNNLISSEFESWTLRNWIEYKNKKTETETDAAYKTRIDNLMKEDYWNYTITETTETNPFKGTADLTFSIDDDLGNYREIVILRARRRYEAQYGKISWEQKEISGAVYYVQRYLWKDGNTWKAYTGDSDVTTDLTTDEQAILNTLNTVGYNFKIDNKVFLQWCNSLTITSTALASDHKSATATWSDGTTQKSDEYNDVSIGALGYRYFRYYTSFALASGSKSITLADGTAVADGTKRIINLDYETYIRPLENEKLVALYSNSASNPLGAIFAADKVSQSSHFSITHHRDNYSDSLSQRAFIGTDYGMYLRDTLLVYGHSVNRKNNSGEFLASISEVFTEICGDDFAKVTVQDLKSLTEAEMRRRMNIVDGAADENEKISVVEYNQFEIISGDNADNPLYKIERNVVSNTGEEGSTGFYNGTTKHLSGRLYNLFNAEWGDSISFDAWCFTRTSLTNLSGGSYRWFLYNSLDGKKEANARIMQFYNMNDKNGTKWTCEPTFSIDPYYGEYDDDGNLLDGDLTSSRSQIDYKIDKNVYFNFGGEQGGYDTEISGPVQWGATETTGLNVVSSIFKTYRMNIQIDTSESDVFVYINAPSTFVKTANTEIVNSNVYYTKDGSGNYSVVTSPKAEDLGNYYEATYGTIFNKCTWQVTGSHHAYIYLVGDSSFAANAYTTEVNWTGGLISSNNDKTDTRMGTHFFSSYWSQYATSFIDTGSEGLDIKKLRVGAKLIGIDESVGDMFIIGSGLNNITIGRGGYTNAFIYIPNGTYINNTKGLLNIIPVASSSSSAASIVAKNILILGSNVGQLVFTAYDVGKTGGTTNAGIGFDFAETTETIRTYTWKFGGYYYG